MRNRGCGFRRHYAHARTGPKFAPAEAGSRDVRRPLTSQERAAEAVGGRLGRPSKLTAEVARAVELDVAEGLTLRQVAARAGVDARTILRRAAADPAFRARYARRARSRSRCCSTRFTSLPGPERRSPRLRRPSAADAAGAEAARPAGGRPVRPGRAGVPARVDAGAALAGAVRWAGRTLGGTEARRTQDEHGPRQGREACGGQVEDPREQVARLKGDPRLKRQQVGRADADPGQPSLPGRVLRPGPEEGFTELQQTRPSRRSRASRRATRSRACWRRRWSRCTTRDDGLPAARPVPEQSFEAPADEPRGWRTSSSRTYATLLEALDKHRGKGQQVVRVERVTVKAGGQAIVGSVAHPGGGGAEESEEQPHAKRLAHAPEPAMRCANPEREAVPVAGGGGQGAVPDARRGGRQRRARGQPERPQARLPLGRGAGAQAAGGRAGPGGPQARRGDRVKRTAIWLHPDTASGRRRSRYIDRLLTLRGCKPQGAQGIAQKSFQAKRGCSLGMRSYSRIGWHLLLDQGLLS